MDIIGRVYWTGQFPSKRQDMIGEGNSTFRAVSVEIKKSVSVPKSVEVPAKGASLTPSPNRVEVPAKGAS